ncbi:DUF2779 domain-containing protein [Devosia albogilva]|uniref:DUF2779 domain-containing protein n=1 Tax=Devosia albogilva TaxID=429726 RepID=A0ABW5QPA3_9HYPH
MRALSKSKLLSYRQCAKRLWLEVHQPHLAEVNNGTAQRQVNGTSVGTIARRVYDPGADGILVDIAEGGIDVALSQSKSLLDSEVPLFEAGVAAGGAMFFADVMIRDSGEGASGWRIVEVKSATSVKPYHEDDAAIQAYVADSARLPLTSISIATIDSSWTYEREGDYRGLFRETDVTSTAKSRKVEVADWIKQAEEILSQEEAPAQTTGRHCSDPFDCGFAAHCRAGEPKLERPADWLPSVRNKDLKAAIDSGEAPELADVPDELLNEIQARVKRCTIEGLEYFDAAGARADLAAYGFPAYFLDFETIAFPVPIWLGTRPYQKIPFQFSLHVVSASGELRRTGFLCVSGANPSRRLAEALLETCGTSGPVFAYNAGFERSVIVDLARTFPDLSSRLLALAGRLADLLPIARARCYHPSQQGSWSIKKVLTAVAPTLRYDDLEGVKDGGMAMDAYLEAIDPDTGDQRKKQIEAQLDRYCELDTFAMVRLWQFFRGDGPEMSLNHMDLSETSHL